MERAPCNPSPSLSSPGKLQIVPLHRTGTLPANLAWGQWASSFQLREATNNPARTSFRQPATGLHTETWSGWFTWWGSTLINEDKPRRSLRECQEILALLLGSGHTLDILSAHAFPFLSVHSKRLGLGQALAHGAGKSEPLMAALLRSPGVLRPCITGEKPLTLFPRRRLLITASPIFPAWCQEADVIEAPTFETFCKKYEILSSFQSQAGREAAFQSCNTSLKKNSRLKEQNTAHSAFRVPRPPLYNCYITEHP